MTGMPCSCANQDFFAPLPHSIAAAVRGLPCVPGRGGRLLSPGQGRLRLLLDPGLRALMAEEQLQVRLLLHPRV